MQFCSDAAFPISSASTSLLDFARNWQKRRKVRAVARKKAAFQVSERLSLSFGMPVTCQRFASYGQSALLRLKEIKQGDVPKPAARAFTDQSIRITAPQPDLFGKVE